MPRRAALAALLTIAAAALLTACGSPPQVLEITPQRGATDVRSTEVIRVRFDRPMDHRSVAERFQVQPRVQGALTWTDDRELAFEHVPLSPSSSYHVSLEPGYRDARGSANYLRHSWGFHTEAAPALTGSSPGPGDRSVDPAAYLTLTFSREMDASTLATAIALLPPTPFAAHQDAGDPRRVVVAPQSLLQPRTSYQVAVAQDARDLDGNRLAAPVTVSFSTGSFRPLRHWIGFIAESPSESVGMGLWIVDYNRLPRQVVGSAVSSFAWSADGSHLLLRSPNGTWSDLALDGTSRVLAISGEWADFLAPGRGYAYLDRGTLALRLEDGSRVTVATGVTGAAVAPGGERLAFVVHDPFGSERATEIDGYDTNLQARYRLQTESEPLDGLSWSADGLSLSYRLDAADATHRQVRVRSLRDGGAVTVATGNVSTPVWQADSQHVVFTAAVPAPGGTVTRAFRFPVADGSRHVLTAAAGIPRGQDIEVDDVRPSPDGHQLAFLSAGGRRGVYTMNADGTGLTRLTDPDPNRFPYSCRDVAWTPS